MSTHWQHCPCFEIREPNPWRLATREMTADESLLRPFGIMECALIQSIGLGWCIRLPCGLAFAALLLSDSAACTDRYPWFSTRMEEHRFSWNQAGGLQAASISRFFALVNFFFLLPEKRFGLLGERGGVINMKCDPSRTIHPSICLIQRRRCCGSSLDPSGDDFPPNILRLVCAVGVHFR